MKKLCITGLGLLSARGDLGECMGVVRGGVSEFERMGDLLGGAFGGQVAGWIGGREKLTNRKWSPITMAVLEVARRALEEAGWGEDERRGAGVVLGTSRGNAAGWLSEWPGRRPFAVMAASNTIHSEPAAAVTIEFGMRGPYQVVASGCAAGLDALGVGAMMVECGVVERVLVVAVDFPLVPMLLAGYEASGLLGREKFLDPYGVGTGGFVPAEGAAAMALECGEKVGAVRFCGYFANSDGVDPVGMPVDGGESVRLIERALGEWGSPQAICPHATGTQVQARAEPALWRRGFGGLGEGERPSVHLLKPYVGHTIGASGLVESVLLVGHLREGVLPRNAEHVVGLEGFVFPKDERVADERVVLKFSHSMGGHNAVAGFRMARVF